MASQRSVASIEQCIAWDACLCKHSLKRRTYASNALTGRAEAGTAWHTKLMLGCGVWAGARASMRRRTPLAGGTTACLCR